MSDQNSNSQTKICPFCAEEIKAAAIVCRYCGRNLPGTNQQIIDQEFAGRLIKKSKLWLFIPIIVLFLILLFACLFGEKLKFYSYAPTAIPIEKAREQTLAAMVATMSPTKNSTISIIEPTSVPLPTDSNNQAGKTRENPIPLGIEKTVGYMAFVITSVQRPADEIVAAGNMFNTKPEATQEYLMIEARSTCLLDSSKKCSFTPMELKAVGSDGNVINSQFVVSGVPGQFETGETFGGSAKAGRLFFMVSKGDPGVVIFYEPMFFGSPTFFSINPPSY
jgi:hypothetical protein